MDAQSRQKALDSISDEDLERIKKHQASTRGSFPVDQEWMLLAEFAKAYGWEAYRAARDDAITSAEMLTLIEANRKLNAIDLYNRSLAAFIGAGSANSKKPSQTFTSMTRNIIKQTKVEK